MQASCQVLGNLDAFFRERSIREALHPFLHVKQRFAVTNEVERELVLAVFRIALIADFLHRVFAVFPLNLRYARIRQAALAHIPGFRVETHDQIKNGDAMRNDKHIPAFCFVCFNNLIQRCFSPLEHALHILAVHRGVIEFLERSNICMLHNICLISAFQVTEIDFSQPLVFDQLEIAAFKNDIGRVACPFARTAVRGNERNVLQASA
ncbi:hypothetical protein D3C76_1006900 [compost metagenome]